MTLRVHRLKSTLRVDRLKGQVAVQVALTRAQVGLIRYARGDQGWTRGTLAQVGAEVVAMGATRPRGTSVTASAMTGTCAGRRVATTVGTMSTPPARGTAVVDLLLYLVWHAVDAGVDLL